MWIGKGSAILKVPEECVETVIGQVKTGGCSGNNCSDCILGERYHESCRCTYFNDTDITSDTFKGVSIFGNMSSHKIGAFYE